AGGKAAATEIVIGGGGVGHVTAGTGGVIAVTTTIDIASGSSLTSKLGAVTIGTGVGSVAGSIGIGTGGLTAGAGAVSGDLRENSHGTIEADGGTLTLSGNVSGSGKLLIDNGAKLTLGGSDTGAVMFESAKGTLRLDHADTMTGKIEGLRIGDIID